jgi:N6-adenosine-specific RNA methylase IME4
MKYKTIYADPPWPEKGGGKIRRGADRHYPLMPVKTIIAMSAELQPFINNDAHLYLWVTNNYLPAGLDVMKAWGFDYKTTITWVKDRMGLGQYFRGQSEHCLFGVRGVLPYKSIDGKRAQGVTAFYAPRTEHSRKPEEMHRMIERVSYAPRLELFARRPAAGWNIWGNQVLPDIKLAA